MTEISKATLSNRAKYKLSSVVSNIVSDHVEIDDMRLYIEPTDNTAGKPTGFRLMFEIESRHEILDHTRIFTVFTRDLSQVPAVVIRRSFRQQYLHYLGEHQIKVDQILLRKY